MRDKPIEDLTLLMVDPVVADKANAVYSEARAVVKECIRVSKGTRPVDGELWVAISCMNGAIDDLERAAE